MEEGPALPTWQIVCHEWAVGAAAPPDRPRKIWLTKGRLLPGCTPDTTAEQGGMMAPHSARPAPSLISATAHCTGLATRAARMAGATEQPVRGRGIATMHDSQNHTWSGPFD